jgi:hypothetical protein
MVKTGRDHFHDQQRQRFRTIRCLGDRAQQENDSIRTAEGETFRIKAAK